MKFGSIPPNFGKSELQYIPFDIETTGLNAPECEVIAWCLEGQAQYVQTDHFNECDLLQNLSSKLKEIKQRSNPIIITFNGGNFYNGGFDFPFLRTRFLMNGLPWPFKGFQHIDIYPIIQKRFNTAVQTWPQLEELTKDQLIQMVEFIGHLTTGINKSSTKPKLLEYINAKYSSDILDDYIKYNIEPKKTDINDLKGAYELLTGDASGEDMDGAQVVQLWKQYKDTGDDSIPQTILEYNRRDTEKTMELFKIVQSFCGSRDLVGEVL